MRPDIIISNPPYGNVGVDITKHLMANHNDSQMAILGTKGMFNKHYGTVALEYVQVDEYQYDPKGGKTKRLDWGVSQAILLAWHRKGHTWTEVIPRGHVYGGHNVPIRVDIGVYVGISVSPINLGGTTHTRTNHVCTVGFPKSEQDNRGICASRTIRVHRTRTAPD